MPNTAQFKPVMWAYTTEKIGIVYKEEQEKMGSESKEEKININYFLRVDDKVTYHLLFSGMPTEAHIFSKITRSEKFSGSGRRTGRDLGGEYMEIYPIYVPSYDVVPLEGKEREAFIVKIRKTFPMDNPIDECINEVFNHTDMAKESVKLVVDYLLGPGLFRSKSEGLVEPEDELDHINLPSPRA